MKWKVFFILVIIVIALSSCTQKQEKTEIEEKSKSEVNATKNITFISDVIPASGAGRDPTGKSMDGPWNHRLLIALSNDGVSWRKTGRILSDQASVPDVIVDENGFVRVYYVDFYNGGIVVAISKDLENWSYIKVKGISPEWVDPSIVLLPDGRFRLYASYMPLEGKQNKIVSAISEDGIHFKIEGVVYESEVEIVDPDVIYADGVWVMFLAELKLEPKLVMLTSEDGLNFRKKREFDLGGDVPCIISYGEGYRLYLASHEKTPSVISYYSDNLVNWKDKKKILEAEEGLDEFGATDPAIAKLPDGSYIMVYKTWIENPWKVKAKEKKQKVVEGKAERLGYVGFEETAIIDLKLGWVRELGAFTWNGR